MEQRASILLRVITVITILISSAATTVATRSIEQVSSVDERVALNSNVWKWKCWGAVKNLNTCLYDINKSIRDNRIILGAGCCENVLRYNEHCLQNVFPLSLFAPKMLKSACNDSSPGGCAPGPDTVPGPDIAPAASLAPDIAPAASTDIGPAAAPDVYHHHLQQQSQKSIPCNSGSVQPLFTQEIGLCVSIIRSIEGCFEEVSTSFFTGVVQIIGSGCCRAVTVDSVVDNECWPKIFPLNPFFPLLIKDHCNSLKDHQMLLQTDDTLYLRYIVR